VHAVGSGGSKLPDVSGLNLGSIIARFLMKLILFLTAHNNPLLPRLFAGYWYFFNGEQERASERNS
jgi:hypothetical protein